MVVDCVWTACVLLWHFGCASCSIPGWVGWHSLCLKSSRKVYRECTSAGLCVTSFNAPYPSAAKQPQTSLESTLPLSIQVFPCIPQLPSASCLKETCVDNYYWLCLSGCRLRGYCVFTSPLSRRVSPCRIGQCSSQVKLIKEKSWFPKHAVWKVMPPSELNDSKH